MKESDFGHGANTSWLHRKVRRLVRPSLAKATVPFNYVTGFDATTGLTIPIKNQFQADSCFHGDTPVLMEDLTYKKIREITVGDRVFTHKGNSKTVLKVFRKKWQGVTKRLKITGDYREIEATTNHPFWAIKNPRLNNKWSKLKNEILIHSQNPSFCWLDELRVGDFVGMPFNNIVRDTTLNSYEKDPDFLWLLGLYLAEGSTSENSVIFSLHRNELRWFEKVKGIIEKYGGSANYYLKGLNGLTVRIGGKKWREIFEELGSKLCDKKKLAKRLMFIEPSLQMQIYNGFNDGDGHKTGKCSEENCDSIGSTSYELLIQMRTILLRNGIFSSLQKRKVESGKKPVWVLERNKTSRFSFIKDNFCFVRIKSIVHNRAYFGSNVWNLEVEDDNSYQVNGIAVHNCGGEAGSYALGIALARLGNRPYIEYSAKSVYSPIFYPGGGTTVTALENRLCNQGAADEYLVPSYYGNPPTTGEAWMEETDWETQVNLTNALEKAGWQSSSVPLDMDSIAFAIQSNGFVILEIGGTNNGTWLSPNPQPPVGQSQWQHFLVAVAATQINGQNAITFLNSWGNEVGNQGRQYFTSNYFNGGILDAFTLTRQIGVVKKNDWWSIFVAALERLYT